MGVNVDSWSDANIMVAARNVAANGWFKYHLVAQHQVDRLPFKSDPFYYYAHYPLGTYYISWIAFGLGARNLAALRWLPTLASLASLVLWYVLLSPVVGRWAALASTLVMGTSFGFLAYADNLHNGYANALVVGMMVCYTQGIARRGRQRVMLLAASWALLFANAFISWEWYLWSQIFYWGHACLIGIPFAKRWLLVFAVAPLLAFGIQQGHRVAVFGHGAGGGVVDDLLRRTIRLEDTADTPPDVTC